MDESVDEGDDASGIGKDVIPLGEGFVSSQDDGALEVPSSNDLEEEVGVAVVVGEIADLVDARPDGQLYSGRRSVSKPCPINMSCSPTICTFRKPTTARPPSPHWPMLLGCRTQF